MSVRRQAGACRHGGDAVSASLDARAHPGAIRQFPDAMIILLPAIAAVVAVLALPISSPTSRIEALIRDEPQGRSRLGVPLLTQYCRGLWKFGGIEFCTPGRVPVQHQFVAQATQLCGNDGAMHPLKENNDFSGNGRTRAAARAVQFAAMRREQGHRYTSILRREGRAA